MWFGFWINKRFYSCVFVWLMILMFSYVLCLKEFKIDDLLILIKLCLLLVVVIYFNYIVYYIEINVFLIFILVNGKLFIWVW